MLYTCGLLVSCGGPLGPPRSPQSSNSPLGYCLPCYCAGLSLTQDAMFKNSNTSLDAMKRINSEVEDSCKIYWTPLDLK